MIAWCVYPIAAWTGVEQGIWSDDLDPTAAAAAIIAVIEGASLWAAVLPERAEEALRQLDQWLQSLQPRQTP